MRKMDFETEAIILLVTLATLLIILRISFPEVFNGY